MNWSDKTDSNLLLRKMTLNNFLKQHNQGVLATYTDQASEREAVKRYTELNYKVHNCELLALLFTAISFAVATVHYEIQFQQTWKVNRHELDLPLLMTALLSLVSGELTLFISVGYYILRQIYKTRLSQFKLPRRRILMFYPSVHDYYKFKRNHRHCCTLQFIYTVVILLVQPLPFFHVSFTTTIIHEEKQKSECRYTVNQLLYALMAIRVIFIVKVLLSYSQYTSLKSKRVARSYGFSANARFGFKAMIQRKPGLTVFLLILFSVLVLSFLLRIFERPYHIQHPSKRSFLFANPFDSIWLICITMTTVGYGDLAPVTLFGRIVAIFTAFWGAVIISFMIVIVTAGLSLNQSQNKAMKDIKLIESASKCVFHSLRYNHIKSRHNYSKKRQSFQKLRKAILKFRSVKNDILETEGFLSPPAQIIDIAQEVAKIKETQATMYRILVKMERQLKLQQQRPSIVSMNGSMIASGMPQTGDVLQIRRTVNNAK